MGLERFVEKNVLVPRIVHAVGTRVSNLNCV